MWGHSSAGRALEWHSRGQEFDPPWLHQLMTPYMVSFFVVLGAFGLSSACSQYCFQY